MSLSQNNIKVELQTIHWLTCSKDTSINGSTMYHIICNSSTDIFTVRVDLILGVSRKNSQMFFVITSARNGGGGGAKWQMYIHVCTFVHTFVIWVPSGPTPPRLYKSIHVTFVFLKNMDPPWLCTVNSKIINKLRPDRNWNSHRNRYRNHHWNPVRLTGSVTGTGTGTRLCHWYLSRKCAIKVTLE